MIELPRRRAALLLLPFALACSDEGDGGPMEPDPPAGDEVATLEVDASAGWALVSFDGDEATSVSIADPTASDAWDIGFFATSVMLNGGAAGPGDVVGHCLCANAALDDASVAALTAAGQLAAFEAVGAAQVPSAGEAWASDALAAAIDGWYSYNPTTHEVTADPSNTWKVRTAAGDAFAKLHVTAIADASQEHAGTVTIEYAFQPAAGAAFEATQSVDLDASAGPVHFDLDTGATVGSAADADFTLDGWDIRVNGGVSGDGSAGASLADQPFADITDAGDLTASHYAGDAFGGVFEAHPWYRYNVEGNHQVWPTYDVYLLKRGETVYKVQLIGYYGATGDSRQITFRYEPVS